MTHHLNCTKYGGDDCNLYKDQDEDSIVTKAIVADGIITHKFNRRILNQQDGWTSCCWEQFEWKRSSCLILEAKHGWQSHCTTPATKKRVKKEHSTHQHSVLHLVWQTYHPKDGTAPKVHGACSVGKQGDKAMSTAHTYVSCVEGQPSSLTMF